MKCSILIAVFAAILCLAVACPFALAQNALPGSLLHLDASRQNQRDKAWRNLGLVGGELLPNDVTPDLKVGTIKVPEVGFNRKLRWYSVATRGEGFAGKPDLNPDLKLGDWTFELLVKRNGPKWPDLVVATQFAGFHSRDRKSQGLRILLHGPDTGKLIAWIKGKSTPKGSWYSAEKLGIDIGKKDWHWIAFVFTSGKRFETYQDGKRVGTMETEQRFDGKEPMWPTLFSAWETDRTFNGAMAIVRIYDRALSQQEINRNISGNLAVDSAGKLATVWASVKTNSR